MAKKKGLILTSKDAKKEILKESKNETVTLKMIYDKLEELLLELKGR